jgi:alpha-N-arabinofuranosidase
MISEGGTAHEHAITIARSKDITKPFVGNPSNPIVTHRHLGRNYPIVNVGHGDLVETQKGEWWMVLLASRPYGGYYRNLGRETFLVPVTWEEGWPVVNYGVGLVEETFTLPDLEPSPVHPLPLKDDFDEDTLHPRYLYLRNPNLSSYSLTTRAGFLHMKLMSETIDELSSPSFVAIRQTSKSFVTKTSMQFAAQTANECAGLVILQSNAYYYQLTSTLIDGQNTLHLIKCEDGQKTILASQIYTGNTLYLSLEANLQDLTFAYSTDGVNHHTLMANVDGRILCTDRAGGFVGNCIGLYCSSNGHESTNHADFDWFSYESID